jgi:hypothetical protein
MEGLVGPLHLFTPFVRVHKSKRSRTENLEGITERTLQNCYAVRTFHIILKCMLKKLNLTVWSGLIWLRIGSTLVNTLMNLRVP